MHICRKQCNHLSNMAMTKAQNSTARDLVSPNPDMTQDEMGFFIPASDSSQATPITCVGVIEKLFT